MPAQKISSALAQQILHLGEQSTSPAEIALQLSLKKMQVSAVLAHQKLNEAKVTSMSDAFPEEDTLDEHKMASIEEEELAPVATAEEDEEESSGGIYVGDDREYGDPLCWLPWETREVQNPHLMIMGESGSGKTYATQGLVAELAQRDIPSVIFDYGQSFELHTLDKQFSKYVNPDEYLIGEHGLALNPLQIFPKDIQGPKAVASRVSDVFDAVYHLGDIQRKVLIDAILRSFDKVGIKVADQATWQNPPPTLTVLQEVLEELTTDKSYPNYKNATSVSARLTTFFMLNSFRNDGSPWSWEGFISNPTQRVHILQFRGLEGKTQRVVVELLLWHLFFYLKSEGQHPLRLYCVLDEAHHLSFRDSGPIDSLLREARKFGLGLIFASQQPEDFSPAAFANSASKLVFQTTDPSLKVSRFLAAKCLNFEGAEQIHDVISVLRQGEAFFISKNKGHTVRIADFNKRATLWPSK